MPRRALLVYNPVARGVPSYVRVHAALEASPGWEVSPTLTKAAGHATALARAAAAEGLDAVIACGGDGTVNEVLNGLAGSATALAVIRGGTANVWAKEARLPRDPARAVRLLAEGETRTIDLGLAGGRYFILLATLGFDAAVVRDVSSGWKARLGAMAYVLHGLRRAITYRAQPAELIVDGTARAEDVYWLVLGNTRSYGGVLDVARWAAVDDGRLDLMLVRKGGLRRMLLLGLWILLRRHRRHANVSYEQVEALDVQSPGLPVQVDGEYLGETPMRFAAAPGALRVIVPRGLRSPLFRDRTPGA